MKRNYTFTAQLWLYPGMTGNWHFVSLPKKDAAEIKKTFGASARGWGSLRVGARIGTTKWKTSIFPDKKNDTYLLPVKADVRIREHIVARDKVSVWVMITA